MKKGQRFLGLVLGLMIGLSLLTVSVLAAMDAAEATEQMGSAAGEAAVLATDGNTSDATPSPSPTPGTTTSVSDTQTSQPAPVDPGQVICSGTCGDSLTWTLTAGGTLTISGSGAMTDYEEGAAPWYDQMEDILVVTIEEGVTSIGANAFCDCYNIGEVTVPSGVISIGDSAFFGCNSLSVVYYTGPEQHWANITVGENNDALQNIVSLYGDVNGDKAVDGKDVVRLMRCILYREEPTGIAAGDFDGNGHMDLADVVRLMRWLAGDDVLLE